MLYNWIQNAGVLPQHFITNSKTKGAVGFLGED